LKSAYHEVENILEWIKFEVDDLVGDVQKHCHEHVETYMYQVAVIKLLQ